MGKPLKELFRRTVYANKGNLMALDDPYPTLEQLLRDHSVTQIIDAGASTGTVSKRLTRWFPEATFHLFDPHPDYTAGLTDLAANDARFKAWPIALSDAPGELTMYLTADRGPSSRFKPNQQSNENHGELVTIERQVTVPATTLDQWQQDEGIAPIQLIKLDIQAGELAALRGARQMLSEQVLVVYTEIFFNPMYEGGALWADIDLELRRNGFLLHNLYKPATLAGDTLAYANAIYIHPDRLRR